VRNHKYQVEQPELKLRDGRRFKSFPVYTSPVAQGSKSGHPACEAGGVIYPGTDTGAKPVRLIQIGSLSKTQGLHRGCWFESNPI
jgi:hypothetical protein